MTSRARRAALAVAVTSGLIGGTLVGAGALGVGGASVAAATTCPAGTVLFQAVGTATPNTGRPQPTVPTGTTTSGDTVTGTVVPADATDPYASAAVADPDSFLCVVPGYGAAPSPDAPTGSSSPTPPAAQPQAPVTPVPAAPAPGFPQSINNGVSLFDSDAPAEGYDPDGIPGPVGGTPAATAAPAPAPPGTKPVAPAPGMIPRTQIPDQPGTPPVTQPSTPGVDAPADENPTGVPLDALGVEVPPVAEELPIGGGEDGGPNDGGERPAGELGGDFDPNQGTTITRDAVIGRAVSWVLQQVPYSQTSWWTDSNGTYRQDCSGYVSMAWNLNQRTNYWTGNLANVSHRIASSSLKPGDVLNLPRSHVVIFAGWANSSKTKFHLYEEYSRGKPARYLTDASLSYYLDRGYGAYRYDKIADVERGKPGAQKTVYELANLAEQWQAPGEDADAMDGVIAAAAQLPQTPWTPDLVEQVTTEAAAPAGLEEQVTPESVPNLPVQTLVDAQNTTDLRAAPGADRAGSGPAMVLVAAGLGLLFLGIPLGVAARTGGLYPRRPTGREGAS